MGFNKAKAKNIISGKTFEYPRKRSSTAITVAGDFPHLALIGYKETGTHDFKRLCVGSLISEKFILSSASCSKSGPIKAPTTAKLGDVRRNDNNSNTTMMEIEKITKHRNYRKSSLENDIALFKLKETVTFTRFIYPICMPIRNQRLNRATATGWVQTGYPKDLSKSLLKIRMAIYNQTYCQSMVSFGMNSTFQLCAGSYTDKKGSCGQDGDTFL